MLLHMRYAVVTASVIKSILSIAVMSVINIDAVDVGALEKGIFGVSAFVGATVVNARDVPMILMLVTMNQYWEVTFEIGSIV